jgi:hypothetical protein
MDGYNPLTIELAFASMYGQLFKAFFISYGKNISHCKIKENTEIRLSGGSTLF